jgi:hypothetical protein
MSFRDVAALDPPSTKAFSSEVDTGSPSKKTRQNKD